MSVNQRVLSFLRAIFPETSRSEAPRCVGYLVANFPGRDVMVSTMQVNW